MSWCQKVCGPHRLQDGMTPPKLFVIRFIIINDHHSHHKCMTCMTRRRLLHRHIYQQNLGSKSWTPSEIVLISLCLLLCQEYPRVLKIRKLGMYTFIIKPLCIKWEVGFFTTALSICPTDHPDLRPSGKKLNDSMRPSIAGIIFHPPIGWWPG